MVRLAEKVSHNIGILRRELTGRSYGCPALTTTELANKLDIISKQLETAMRDEEEAKRMYERLRADMTPVFPPGTIPYDIIMSIGEDEQLHYEKLRDLRDIIVEGLKKAIKIA